MEVQGQLIFKDLERQILDGVLGVSKDVLDRAFSSAVFSIGGQVGNLIERAIKASPEYTEIISGRLGQELGIPHPASAMQTIIIAIQNAVSVTYKQIAVYARQLRGGITVELLRRDFSDALSAAGATFISNKGATIPWLSWLLTEGDRIIIANYEIIVDPKDSRTGGLIMGKTKRGGWRIPSEYSGTPRDNFLTRALDSVVTSVGDIIEREVERRI